MVTPRIIQGRRIDAEELALIRGLIAGHPQWSRRQLSIGFCERVQWRSPAGQLKDMSARLLFAKLAEQGLITCPPRQRRGGRQRLRALAQPDLFEVEGLVPEPITAALAILRPLEVILAEPGSGDSQNFVRHLARHHYLGWGGSSGANLRYLIRDRHGRDLACVLFAAAA